MKKFLFLILLSSCAHIQGSSATASAITDAKSAKESWQHIQTITIPDEIFYPFFGDEPGGFDRLIDWLQFNDINNKIVLIPMAHENLLWLKAIDQFILHNKTELFDKLLEQNAHISKNLDEIIAYLSRYGEQQEIIKRLTDQATKEKAVLEKAQAAEKEQAMALNKQKNEIMNKNLDEIEKIVQGFKNQWENAKTNADKINIIEKNLDIISKNSINPHDSLKATSYLDYFITLTDFLSHVEADLNAKLMIAQINQIKRVAGDVTLPAYLKPEAVFKRAEAFNADYQKRNDVDPKLKEQLQAALKK